MFCQKILLILIKLYSIYFYSVSCNPSLNGLVTINDGNDQIQEESSSYLQFAKIPDEDDTRKILLQMGNNSVHTTTNDLDFSASSNIAQMLNNLNDNEQRHLQQQLQTNEDPLQKILPKVKFDCKNLKEGYYADPEFNCEVFHFCKSNGFRFTLVCPPKAKYNQKAMTCVYEDNQLYGCPQKESINNLNSDWDQKFNLTSYNETKIGNDEIDIMSTNNSSSIDKNSVEEENKLSSWNDIINKSNKQLSYTSSSTISSIPNKTYNLNQILTTISTNNVEEKNAENSILKNITDNWPSTSYSNEPSVQYGTRFNSINSSLNKNKTISKKLSLSSGYEDLYTKYQKKKKQNHFSKAVGTTTINPLITTIKNSFSIDEDILSDVSSTEQILSKPLNNSKQTESEEKTRLLEGNLNLNNSSIKDHLNIITEFSNNAEKNKLANDNESNKIILNDTVKSSKNENYQNSYEKNNDKYFNDFNAYQSNQNNINFLNNMDLNRISDKNLGLSNNQQDFLNDLNEGGFKPIFVDNDNKFLSSNHRYQTNKNDFKDIDVINYDSVLIKESLNQSNYEKHKKFFNQDNSLLSSSLFTPNPNSINNYSTSSSSNAVINLNVKNPNIEYSDQSNKTFSPNQTLSNNLINENSIYQSRENFKLMVKEVSNEKLKDFIKSNDLVDLSSTAFSNLGNRKTVTQPLNEKYLKYQAEIKFKNKPNSTFVNNGKNFVYKQFSNAFPDFRATSNLGTKNDKQQQLNKDQFSNNFLPKIKPENSNYNAYKLDSISEDPNFKYDYVFGLSKFLPSINGQLPPFFLDSNLMSKNSMLYPDFYSHVDMQTATTNNLDQSILQKKFIQNDRDHLMTSNQQFLSNSKLPIWLKNKFLNKPSTINRNTANNLFSNSNNFLHSAASSSFNYPLYELPPPSILKQQQQNRQNTQPIALPLISSNLGVASSNSQTQNEVNINKLISSSVMNSPSNVLTDNLALQQNNPLKSMTAQNTIPNTRKNFFSQLSRLFSSASIPRPVRVPYTSVNLASAISSLTQPFSKLQIDNFSNQIFSPINRFLNATTSYIPFSKDNLSNSQKTTSSSTSKLNTISEDDVIDDIENQILNSNLISSYPLNNKNVYNQGLTNQPASYLPSQQNPNVLNLNNFNLNSLPMNQPFYEPIKRSFKNNYQQNLLKNYLPKKHINPFINNFKFTSIERDDNRLKYFPDYQNLMKKSKQEYLFNPYSFNSQDSGYISPEKHINDLISKETIVQEDDDDEDSTNFIKRRRKRSIPFSSPFFHGLQKNNFQSKFIFPLIPQINLMQTPMQNNYMQSPNYLYNMNPALPLAYPTPMIPTVQHFSTPVDIEVSESQKSKKVEKTTLPPIIKKSILASTLNTSNSSFVPLSIVSAANQIATSLSNLSKHHKHTKKTIEKHLSKFTSKTTELNTTETKSVSTFQSPNKTIEYQNVQAKPVSQSWEYSSQLNSKPLSHEFPLAHYPFINNFRSNIPSFNFVPDNLNTASYHHNTKIIPTIQDYNSIFYQTSPSNNFQLTQIPKLKIEYRPAKTMNTLISSFNNDYYKTNELDEHFSRKPKLETSNEFRDLLNIYKQSSNLNEEFYTPLKSIYSTNKFIKEEGQTSNNKYSTNYGFPKSALKIMTVENKQKIGSNQYNHYLKNSKSKKEVLPLKTLTVKQVDELTNSLRSFKQPNSFDYKKIKNEDFLNFDSDSSINFFDKSFHKETQKPKTRNLPIKKSNAYKNLNEDDYFIVDKSNYMKKNFDKNNYDAIYDNYIITALKKSNKKNKKNMSHLNFDKNYEEHYYTPKPKPRQITKIGYKAKMIDSKSKLSPKYSESSNHDYRPEDYEEDFFNEKNYKKDEIKFKNYQNNLEYPKSKLRDYSENLSSKKINSENYEEDGEPNYQYDTNDYKNQNDNYSNSRLIRTNSFSFEIPNHSKHEDVEFEKLNDKNIHEKQEFNKFITSKRPSYSLDYSSRKASSIGKLPKHGQPLQTIAPSPDYYDQRFKSKNDEKDSNFASSKSEKDFFYKVPNLKFKPKKNLSPNFDAYPKEKKINHHHYILHSHKNDRHNQNNNYDEVKFIDDQKNYYDLNYLPKREKYRNPDKKDVNKEDFNDKINEDNYKNDKKFLKQSFDWHSSIQHNNDKSGSNHLNKQEHASLDNIKLFDENEFNIFSDNEQFNQNLSNNFEKNQFDENLLKNNQLNSNNDAFYDNIYNEKNKQKKVYKHKNNYDNIINDDHDIGKINSNLLNENPRLKYKEEKNVNLDLNNIDEDYEIEPNYSTKLPINEKENKQYKNSQNFQQVYDDLTTTKNYNSLNKLIVSTTLAPYTATKKAIIHSTTIIPKTVKPINYKSKYMTSNEYTEKHKTNKNSQGKIVGKLMTRSTERPITTTTFSPNKNINYHKTEYKNPIIGKAEIKKNINTPDYGKKKEYKPYTRVVQTLLKKETNNNTENKIPKIESQKILNTNLQNSSTTINTQVLDKLPVSIDTIFDSIDEENFDYYNEHKNVDENNNEHKKLQNKKGDLSENNLFASLSSKKNSNKQYISSTESSIQTTEKYDQPSEAANKISETTSKTTEFGSRLNNFSMETNKLNPKVSIKASYSSISSTMPRALAQKMESNLKNNILDSTAKKIFSSNILYTNFSKNELNDNTIKNISSTEPSNISSQDKSNKSRLFLSWRGFNARQQKLIDQKKKKEELDEKIKKKYSIFVNKKSLSEDKHKTEPEIQIKTITTLKTTSTTVPTTTIKTITEKYNHNLKYKNLFFKDKNEKFNKTEETHKILKNNYNFKVINDKLENDSNELEITTSKPYRKIFTSLIGGSLQEKTRQKV